MAVELPSAQSPLANITYDDLYARWERGNWRATDLDFSEDRRQWHEDWSDVQRRAALWNYAMFFHGEDSVADNLSPYIDAAPREEHKYFLATQQVDEARHAVFFARFMREVVDRGETVSGALDSTRAELTWGFRKVFERLDRMAEELRRDRSRANLARGITLYHLVIEGALAQPGQHFIESYLERQGTLPGFREGMRNVAQDEQRHIGFGVKLLSELIVDPEARAASLELLREVLPWSVAVFVPPSWDLSYTECFGFTLEEIYAEGTQSLWTKLRTAGFSDEEITRNLRFAPDVTPEERARRALVLLRAGVLGEKTGPPTPGPEVMRLFFDTIENAVDPSVANGGALTVQWDFADAEPWHVRVEGGAARAEAGRTEAPDLTFRCRFEDWVDVVAGREDPRLQIARGRIRLRGGLPAIWRSRKLFVA